jgi:ribonucleoside-diphosphate reductase alpha chain
MREVMQPENPISQQIWDMKYRLKTAAGEPVDKSLDDTWGRVAHALAEPEADREAWAARFLEAMRGHRFLPAGRILAGAGSERSVTLFNCFVMGLIPDDMSGIFENLKEAALTMQQGGGIGYDFSTLRPRGAPVKGVGADASGPVSFMHVWDAMCRTIMSAGYRRGAMMGTLRCDHPDIEAFIDAKRTSGTLTMFNMSVLVTDDFMQAVREDADWDLVFDGVVFRTLRARDLWNKIMRATYDYAEPGVIFIDRINQRNNLWYCETISATNPCGEQPLPPYGACLLGSINLARLVRRPFEADAALDIEELRTLTRVAVRALDNAIDCSRFPLESQRQEAEAKRRIGLGVTGLADALAMCGLVYGSTSAVEATRHWMRTLQREAYLASTELAAEKGAFPLFDKEKYLIGETIAALDADVREAIARNGMRNGLVTSVAPTGTISLLAENVSSGLEPVYAYSYRRNVLMPDGSRRQERVRDYAYTLFREIKGADAPLPESFVSVADLAPAAHLAMQAAVQEFVDASVSKTINVPQDLGFEEFKNVYLQAYEMGCKGCTTYRPNEVTGAVLEAEPAGPQEAEGPQDAEGPRSLAAAPEEPASTVGMPEPARGVVYMTRPLDRPEALPGRTYKLRWPESDHALYITINDVVQDGRRRPFEIFINSKNMEHYAWTVALTRMISAVFRRGGDVAFVVEELKAVFDPRGGAWQDGKYVPSLLAAIGEVIERHMVDIGFLPADRASQPQRRAEVVNLGETGGGQALPKQCPKCGAAAMIYQEGCDLCTSCGHSKCS